MPRNKLTPKPILAPKKVRREYRKDIAEEITDLFISGYSLPAIALKQGMPAVTTIYRWLQQFPEFRKMIEEARAVRAIAFEDMAIEAAVAARDKEEVPAARLRADVAMWAASVNNASQYGRRTTVSGDNSNPIQIIVSTGVPLSKEEEAKQITQEVILDGESK